MILLDSLTSEACVPTEASIVTLVYDFGILPSWDFGASQRTKKFRVSSIQGTQERDNLLQIFQICLKHTSTKFAS